MSPIQANVAFLLLSIAALAGTAFVMLASRYRYTGACDWGQAGPAAQCGLIPPLLIRAQCGQYACVCWSLKCRTGHSGDKTAPRKGPSGFGAQHIALCTVSTLPPPPHILAHTNLGASVLRLCCSLAMLVTLGLISVSSCVSVCAVAANLAFGFTWMHVKRSLAQHGEAISSSCAPRAQQADEFAE